MNLVRLFSTNFSWHTALLFGGSVDFYHRYFMIQSILPLLDDGIILDVGSGKIGIGAFLQHNPDIICLDIDPHSVKSTTGHPIVASASNIPLRPVIAVSVSADCYEHLPRTIRKDFIKDLVSISRSVILHFPTGKYAEECDIRFDRTHIRLFGSPQKMHAEHLRYGLPTLDELNLPTHTRVTIPSQNANINYILFVLQSIPVLGWFTGILFKLLLQGRYDKPPYYSCMVVWVR